MPQLAAGIDLIGVVTQREHDGAKLRHGLTCLAKTVQPRVLSLPGVQVGHEQIRVREVD